MLRSLSDDLLSLLLPGRCPGCGKRAEPVCEACEASMRVAPPGRADRRGLAVDRRVRVRRCRPGAGRAREVSQRAGRGAVARAPGSRSVARYQRPRSMSSRGFRRARAAARRVVSITERCSRASLPPSSASRPNGCCLRDNGPPQTGRPVEERRAGPALRGTGSIAGRSVLVVDDVVTTGATLSAAARVLRDRGARDVIAATVARTPRPGERIRGAAYTRPS